MIGASNSEVLGDASEGHRDEPVREEGSGLCDHQHHFSSLSAAAAQVRDELYKNKSSRKTDSH